MSCYPALSETPSATKKTKVRSAISVGSPSYDEMQAEAYERVYGPCNCETCAKSLRLSSSQTAKG